MHARHLQRGAIVLVLMLVIVLVAAENENDYENEKDWIYNRWHERLGCKEPRTIKVCLVAPDF